MAKPTKTKQPKTTQRAATRIARIEKIKFRGVVHHADDIAAAAGEPTLMIRQRNRDVDIAQRLANLRARALGHAISICHSLAAQRD